MTCNLLRLKGAVTKEGVDATFGNKFMTEEPKMQAMQLMDKPVAMAHHAGSLDLPPAVVKGFCWMMQCGTSECSPITISVV